MKGRWGEREREREREREGGGGRKVIKNGETFVWEGTLTHEGDDVTCGPFDTCHSMIS